MTCLFIGNLIKAVNDAKLYSVFSSYGKCKVDLKGPYAFVEYDDPEQAKNALKDLNKTSLKGVNGLAKARIEFSKKRKINDKLEDNDIENEQNNYADYIDLSDDSEAEEKKNNSIKDKITKYSSEKRAPREIKESKFSEFSMTKENENPEKNEKNEKFLSKKVIIEDSEDGNTAKKKNVCFICKLPGHFAKDCVLTRDSCYECGEKGHIAKECQGGVREAKMLTKNRVKAIFSQQSAYKFISPGNKIRNIINYLNSNK